MKKDTSTKTNSRRNFIKKAALGTIAGLVLSEATSEAQSASKICNVGNGAAYKLNVDGSQYIVISSGSGVAIVKHR